MNEGQESLFAVGRQGSKEASWIQTNSTYEFRLYNSDRTKLLDTVIIVKEALQTVKIRALGSGPTGFDNDAQALVNSLEITRKKKTLQQTGKD